MIARNDEQLVRQYLKGDEKLLEVLIKQYLKPIYNFVYRYVGNQQDAEDITQEVFVKMWRNIKKFNPQKKFKTWIFSVAKNTAVDFFKKKKIIPFSELEDKESEDSIAETLIDPTPLPSELIERANINQILNSAVDKLPPKYRLVLFLYYNDHFNFREIAEVLGEPIDTIKSRHRRGLIRLKKIFVSTS